MSVGGGDPVVVFGAVELAFGVCPAQGAGGLVAVAVRHAVVGGRRAAPAV
jgi:hypothetical protein